MEGGVIQMQAVGGGGGEEVKVQRKKGLSEDVSYIEIEPTTGRCRGGEGGREGGRQEVGRV